MATITLGPDFGYVVLALAGIALQVPLGGFGVGAARRKVFANNKELQASKEVRTHGTRSANSARPARPPAPP